MLRSQNRGARRGRKPVRVATRLRNMTHPVVNPRLQFVKSGTFVPSRFRTSLRIGAGVAAAASTSIASIALAGNNLFDPLLATGTAKCVGWTQLAALYNRYRVIGSKIHITGMMSASATAGVTQISGSFVTYPSNLGTGRTLYADAISQPFAKFQDINSSSVRTINSVMSTAQITGNKTVDASDRTQGLISGAPGEEWYWIVSYISDVNYTNGQVVLDFNITYDVEFFDRNDADRSSLTGQEISKLYDQIYQLRCKQLKEESKPHNLNPPWNEAKYPDLGSKEAKEEDHDWQVYRPIHTSTTHRTEPPTPVKESLEARAKRLSAFQGK